MDLCFQEKRLQNLLKKVDEMSEKELFWEITTLSSGASREAHVEAKKILVLSFKKRNVPLSSWSDENLFKAASVEDLAEVARAYIVDKLKSLVAPCSSGA